MPPGTRRSGSCGTLTGYDSIVVFRARPLGLGSYLITMELVGGLPCGRSFGKSENLNQW